MVIRKLVLLFCLVNQLVKLSAQDTSPFRLSPVLQRHMVIQQNKPFNVWGYAPKGTRVSISADWLATDVVVTADSSHQFVAILDVPSIQRGDYTPHSLNVEADHQSIVLDSLLIGDVWICAGQSNMQFPLKEDEQASYELPRAHHPNIRLFNTVLNFSELPLDSVGGTWELCTPETVKDFSAVGYYLAKKLQDSLQYPIGVIFTGVGASSAQAYVPKNVLQEDSVLNEAYLAPYLESPRSKEHIDGGFSFEKVTRPYLLYNAMIHPFSRLSITGFCWYQGEANHLERESYTRLIQVMIETWRQVFKQGQLPFHYVQIAPFDHEKRDPKLAFDAFFREAQASIADLNNTEMIVSVDIGETDNLHPHNKKPLGERLALTALNRTYGKLHVPYEGPKMQYVDYQDDKAVIHYASSSIAAGLCTSDNRAPAFFYLAGEDRVFHPAEATIKANTVELKSNRVKHPVAVRYAFFNYPETNLQNGAGLPALPFRTDNWPE